MKTFKYTIVWSWIICFFAMAFITVLEFKFDKRLINYDVSFLSGHRTFIVNVLIGVLSSSFLTLATAYVGYNMKKSQLYFVIRTRFDLIKVYTTGIENFLRRDSISDLKNNYDTVIKLIEEIKMSLYDYYDFFYTAPKNKLVWNIKKTVTEFSSDITPIETGLQTCSSENEYYELMCKFNAVIKEYTVSFAKLDEQYLSSLKKTYKKLDGKNLNNIKYQRNK